MKKRINAFKYSRILIILAVICIYITGCGAFDNSKYDQYIFNGFYFNTYVQITVYGEFPDETVNGLKEMLEHYDCLFSESSEEGILDAINSNESEIVLDDESAYLIKFMIDGANLTDGKFDPTIYPVSQLWNFGENEGDIPEGNQLSDALSLCDYTRLHLDGNVLKKENTDIKISFGAVAKGYIADKTAEYLKNNGIENALINLGGNVYCLGLKNGLDKYNIAIKKPFSDNEAATTVSVSDGMSVVTSGIYERYFELNDTVYHHILDTTTGYPVQNGLGSVTVIGPESMICDFLSTAYFVTYDDKEINDKLNAAYPDYEVIYVSPDGKIL